MRKFEVMVDGMVTGVTLSVPDLTVLAHTLWALSASYVEGLPDAVWVRDAKTFASTKCGIEGDIFVSDVLSYLDTSLDVSSANTVKLTVSVPPMLDGYDYKEVYITHARLIASQTTKGEIKFNFASLDYNTNKGGDCRISVVSIPA